MSQPTVSVIIPTYNRLGMIGATIENMERQTLRPYEIIVVDDGSTDGSLDYLRGLGDRIKLVEQENKGPGAARNAGLAIATGDYVQFFDSDDLCMLDKIERQAMALEASGADIAYGPWTQIWFEGDRAIHDGPIIQQGPAGANPLSAFLRGWVCLIPCCVIRRALLTRLGGYPTAARTAEDLELFFRALINGARLIHVPGPMVLVRQHPGNQISASPEGEAMRLRDRARLMRLVEDLLAVQPRAASTLDRFSWGLSAQEVFRDERIANAGSGSRPWTDLILRLVTRMRQIRDGFRMRLTGSRLSRYFAPQRITSIQQAGISALGYTPEQK